MVEVAVGVAPGEQPVALTSRCVVTARPNGVQFLGDIMAPPIFLGWRELEILAACSRGQARTPGEIVSEVAKATGGDAKELRQFVKRSAMGGRLGPETDRFEYQNQDHPAFGTRSDVGLSSDRVVVARLPMVFQLQEGRYELLDHAGRRIVSLAPSEVAALDALVQPTTVDGAVADIIGLELPDLGAPDQVQPLLALLEGAGLLKTVEFDDPDLDSMIDRPAIIRAVFDRHAEAHDMAEAERVARTGVRRTRVIPVAFDMGTPTALGMIIALAKSYQEGALDAVYDFRTDWVWNDDRLDQFTSEPAVYLFSNYLWSHEQCLEVSRRVKERSPESITIHGGPDTPKYEQDAHDYLLAYPHVDIIVRGEGEFGAVETLTALVTHFEDPGTSAISLGHVAGITYRDGDHVVRTEDRARIADLDVLPSPFLTGLFDVFAEVPELFVTLESNRGCPYGCTFCDWGSATTSRVRQYDLDRVYSELDWCSEVRVSSVSLADANFGMFARDVEIAEHVADLHRATGHPPGFGVSFAKNTVRHLEKIIRVLADAGVFAQGVLSLQSMDPSTLESIRRSNIKTERYDQIAGEMRRADLPLMIELMMGLPGQTITSFLNDLQECIDREMPARVNQTTVLVNSPMNSPEYREAHAIETGQPVGPGAYANVVATSSFTRDDYKQMEFARRGMLIYENFGMLRIVSRYVRQEAGRREVDFYYLLRTKTMADPGSWPALRVLVEFGHSMMTAPVSWARAMDDLGRFLVSEMGLPDDDALATVLLAQQAVLPSHGRTFPIEVPLEHDLIAWYQAMISAKANGHLADWQESVPRLREFGPTVLLVDDPEHVSDQALGMNSEMAALGCSFELDSPFSRARIASTQLVDWATDRIMPRASLPRPKLAKTT